MFPASLKESAVEFLTLVAQGQVDEAYERHVGDGFRHHNPWFHGDAASLREAMRANAKQHPYKTLAVKQVLQDGERVAVLSHMTPKPDERGVVVVHLLRFEHGRIVELWDVGQSVPETHLNENGLF